MKEKSVVPVVRDVLDDHVDVKIGFGDRPQDLVGDARDIGRTKHRELGLVAIECDSGDDRLFHLLVFLNSESGAFAFVLKLESTRSLTLYLPANSTERICRTFEPRLAISSISSKVMVSSLRASGTTRGSVVWTRQHRYRSGIHRHWPLQPERPQRYPATTAKGRDVAFLVCSLEPCDNDNIAFGKIARIRSSSICRMRALVKVLSVRTRTCGPVCSSWP